jgi:hypothetical protein
MTRPDSSKLEGFEERLTLKARYGAVKATDCHVVGEDHEVVPGTWSISIVYAGATLAKRSYRVEREQ